MKRSRNTLWAVGLLMLTIAGLGTLSLLSDKTPEPAAQAADTIVVHKSPTCSCCGKWVDHLRAEGFTVEVHDENDMSTIKSRLGVPARLASCHTATVGGYLIEGHVPADDIKRLLKEKPQARGLVVRGMPVGSPGMEMGGRHMPYETMLIRGDEVTTYAHHGQ